MQTDHFIPLSVATLLAPLATKHPELVELTQALRQHWHVQHYAQRCQLLDNYLPFADDTDEQQLNTSKDKTHWLEQFQQLTKQANFRQLEITEIEQVLNERSPHGLEVKVDLQRYQRLWIFCRGEQSTTLRWRRWRIGPEQQREIRAFQRLLLLVESADQSTITLKLFKDIPRPDLEMLLPDCPVKMHRWDKIKLGVTGGGGTIAGIVSTAGKLTAAANPMTLVVAIAGFAGLLFRQVSKVFAQRNRYMMQLSKHLYSHQLASNASVLSRLLDSAENEELKEMLLAYGWLLQSGQAMTAEQLDQTVEGWLLQNHALKADFDISDALNKLQHLSLVEYQDNHYQAVSPQTALTRLRS